jgi:hypothetical protein
MIHIRAAPVLLRATHTASAPASALPPPTADPAPALPDRHASKIQIRSALQQVVAAVVLDRTAASKWRGRQNLKIKI